MVHVGQCTHEGLAMLAPGTPEEADHDWAVAENVAQADEFVGRSLKREVWHGFADLQRPHRNVRVEKLPGRSNDCRASIVVEYRASLLESLDQHLP
jgi:hypothetical protein